MAGTMEWWNSQHWHLAWMTLAIFMIAYLGSPRHSGQMAFRRVKRLLQQALDNRRYTQFHGLVLPTGGGREALDHVVISRWGIQVIVSEYRKGEISGGEAQELWKQVHFGRTRRWPNPIHRARLQMETLQSLLGIPRDCFQLLVAVDGQDKLSSRLPAQVVRVEQLLSVLDRKGKEKLTPEQADRVVNLLESNRMRSQGVNKAVVLQLLLGVGVIAGGYVVYGASLRSVMEDFSGYVERRAAPERFDDSGRRKSEQELFEESLTCAYSADTNRCSCYEAEGEKAEIEFDRCRELSERGSILLQ